MDVVRDVRHRQHGPVLAFDERPHELDRLVQVVSHHQAVSRIPERVTILGVEIRLPPFVSHRRGGSIQDSLQPLHPDLRAVPVDHAGADLPPDAEDRPCIAQALDLRRNRTVCAIDTVFNRNAVDQDHQVVVSAGTWPFRVRGADDGTLPALDGVGVEEGAGAIHAQAAHDQLTARIVWHVAVERAPEARVLAT
jgi:hypothetical protein